MALEFPEAELSKKPTKIQLERKKKKKKSPQIMNNKSQRYVLESLPEILAPLVSCEVPRTLASKRQRTNKARGKEASKSSRSKAVPHWDRGKL